LGNNPFSQEGLFYKRMKKVVIITIIIFLLLLFLPPFLFGPSRPPNYESTNPNESIDSSKTGEEFKAE
jgi:hypothetical protein